MKRKICMLLVVLGMLLIFPVTIKAEIYTMDPSFLSEMKLKGIDLSINTLNKDEIEIKNSNITRLDVDSNNIAFIINNNNGNAVTYIGSPYLARFKFENVGSIGDHSIDAFVSINKISMGNMWTASGKRNPDGTLFFMVKSASIWFGCASTTLEDYVYSADQDIDISVNLVWSGTTTTVDYPFVTGIFDLDANKNQTNNKTVEKWTAGSGYSKNYFVYETTTLVHTNDTWSNGLEEQNTTGSDERLLTGVYAESNNGAFSSSYREGHSATALKIYATSPNDVNQLEPTKTAKVTDSTNNIKSNIDSTTDKIVYTITQKLGTMFIDMFTPYSSFSIVDIIPDNLNYQSAIVQITDGNTTTDITNNSTFGSLNYNPTTQKLEYTFNPTWLSNRSNYNGQTVAMIINTAVENIVSEYSNTAYTYINSIDMPTNTTVNTSSKYIPTYSYISGTSGKNLPNEISVSSGSYAIGDNNEYLIGETVTRNNSIAVGTKYKAYDSNSNLLGTWELKSWNADSLEMTNNGIEFIGTWEYTEAGIINVIDSSESDYLVEFNTAENEIIDSVPLTSSDLTQLENGKSISIYLEVKDISDSISESEKANYEGKINEDIGLYLDLRLFKKIDGEEATRIPKTDDALNVSFEIPDELINTNPNEARLYKLLKIVGDNLIEVPIDVDNGILTFETDDFVSYILAYSDYNDVPNYRYVSGTPGKNLPGEINTLNGDYAISDNVKYSIGDVVTRNNSIAIGTKYKEYDSNDNLLGTWELKSWNADSMEMTSSGVEFIGTWEYITIGEVNIVDPETPNPYNAILDNADEVSSKIPLTLDDIDNLEAGKDINVYLEVKDISDSISESDKEKISEVLDENQESGLFLDVGLFKKIDGEEATRITKTTDPIGITFEVPEELINKDSNITRTYKIFKLTDEGVTELDVTFNNGTLAFETDEFVNYVIVYEDTLRTINSNPITNDKILSYISMLGLSIIGLVSIVAYTIRKRYN